MKISYIEGLKGLGALMVFLTHYRMAGLLSFNSSFFKNPIISLLMSGNVAVELFIMVSAYSVAMSIERKLNSTAPLQSLKYIIVKRYFRLAIPIASILIIEGVLYPFGIFNPHEVAEQLGGHSSVMRAYQSLTYTFNGLIQGMFLSPIGKCYGWLNPAWMLRYIFYGTFVVIILKIGVWRQGILGKLIIYLLFAVLLSAISIHYFAVVTGAALTEINHAKYAIGGRKDIIFAIFFLSLAISLYKCVKTEMTPMIVATIILFGSIFSKCFQLFFSSKPMSWLGGVSLGMYLIHWPLICSFSVRLYSLLEGFTAVTRLTIVFSSTCLLLLILSKIYVEFFEKRICNTLVEEITKIINGKLCSKT